ncbi:hypothetical protein Hypma_001674 [Hypsizygus marmoreus]|uniref:Uncharacterized protein n=1 Tax=Hypsizygus marmoreus TaxID=39966 RepID=A0A369J7H2_HYPMA|nr:hypothetical protein Hypma_001674 [Hypsizygus marmoreus]
MTAVDMSVLAPTPVDVEKELYELDDDDKRMMNEQGGLARLLDHVSSTSEPGPDETTMGGRGEEVEDLPAFSDDKEGAVKEDDTKSRKCT